MSELKTIAIVGRTNVGKSTLFNRLVGKKQAIVHDMPGVTRDRKEGTATLSDIMFRVIDTAGLETETSLSKAMWAQTQKAIDDADIVLMVVDARGDLNPLDTHPYHERYKHNGIYERNTSKEAYPTQQHLHKKSK